MTRHHRTSNATIGAAPQLDAGIKQMLDELKTKPYVAPKQPKYPNRAGMGMEKQDI